MANQKLCDFCKEIIVNDKIYYLSITESDLPKQVDKLLAFMTLEKAISIFHKKQEDLDKNTEHFEICSSCKKVINYLLTMRADNLKILKNEINGILKLPYKKEDLDDKK